MILGILMVLMTLQTWEIFNFIPSVNLISKSKRRGFVGAFLAGILGGIFSSPCSTPVLIALLAIVAGEGNLIWGILLMLLHSIGHSALVMVAGTSVGFVQNIQFRRNLLWHCLILVGRKKNRKLPPVAAVAPNPKSKKPSAVVVVPLPRQKKPLPVAVVLLQRASDLSRFWALVASPAMSSTRTQ